MTGYQSKKAAASAKTIDEVNWADHEPVAWKETDEVECPVCQERGFPWPKCGHITYLERTPPQRTWIGLTDKERSGIEDYCEMIIGKAAFDAIEAKIKEKNSLQ